MKHIKHSLVLLTMVLLGSVTAARADVAVSFSSGHHSYRYADRSHRGRYYPVDRHGHRPIHHSYHNSHYPRYYHARPRHYHPYQSVVVVPQPYYVQPVATPAPALSNADYGSTISDFRERLNRLYSIVEKQKSSGSIDAAACDRFTQTLNALDKDQRARAYNRGGNLSSDDFADLFRRLDQADEDIELALAQ